MSIDVPDSPMFAFRSRNPEATRGRCRPVCRTAPYAGSGVRGPAPGGVLRAPENRGQSSMTHVVSPRFGDSNRNSRPASARRFSSSREFRLLSTNLVRLPIQKSRSNPREVQAGLPDCTVRGVGGPGAGPRRRPASTGESGTVFHDACGVTEIRGQQPKFPARERAAFLKLPRISVAVHESCSPSDPEIPKQPAGGAGRSAGLHRTRGRGSGGRPPEASCEHRRIGDSLP